jgi:hypothetical protein
MKGVTLPIETIVVLVLAVIVLGVLLWFFATSSTPGIQLTKLKQEQSIWCSSYQQNNHDCDENDDDDVGDDIKNKLADICYKLNQAEGGYSSCGGTFSNACAKECCSMFCGEPPETASTTTTTT